MEPTLPTPPGSTDFPATPEGGRLRVVVEPLVLLAICIATMGWRLFLPGYEALGHPTRDLFDHLALLDQWSLSLPHQAFPDGGSFFPPDLTGMALAAGPLALGLPRATAWNVMVLLQLWLACVAAWALGRRYGAGLVAGVAYGLSPYLVGQALTGEAETLSAWPLPLMALLLERAADHWRGRAEGSPVRWLIGAGIAGAFGALGAWYHGAFVACYLGVWVAVRGWSASGGFDRRALLAPLAFAVTIAPVALVYLQILGAEDQLFRGPDMAAYLETYPRALAGMVADPAAFFGPATAGVGHVDALGAVIVALALLGALRGGAGPERSRWWWAVVGGALLLALGPVLHVRGAPVFAWMPYRALAELPLFGLMRLPHRWLLLASLGLAVLAARGARGFPWVAVFLIWGEMNWFLVPNRPVTDIAVPELTLTVDGPVLDLPARTIGLDARGRYLVWQRSHGQPVAYTLLMQAMGPSIAAEPLVQAAAGLDKGDPIVEKLAEASQFRQEDFARAAAPWRHGRGDETTLEGGADRLRAMGYRYVILHGRLVEPEDGVRIYAMLREQLGDPTAEGGEAVMWTL